MGSEVGLRGWGELPKHSPLCSVMEPLSLETWLGLKNYTAVGKVG